MSVALSECLVAVLVVFSDGRRTRYLMMVQLIQLYPGTAIVRCTRTMGTVKLDGLVCLDGIINSTPRLAKKLCGCTPVLRKNYGCLTGAAVGARSARCRWKHLEDYNLVVIAVPALSGDSLLCKYCPSANCELCTL